MVVETTVFHAGEQKEITFPLLELPEILPEWCGGLINDPQMCFLGYGRYWYDWYTARVHLREAIEPSGVAYGRRTTVQQTMLLSACHRLMIKSVDVGVMAEQRQIPLNARFLERGDAVTVLTELAARGQLATEPPRLTYFEIDEDAMRRRDELRRYPNLKQWWEDESLYFVDPKAGKIMSRSRLVDLVRSGGEEARSQTIGRYLGDWLWYGGTRGRGYSLDGFRGTYFTPQEVWDFLKFVEERYPHKLFLGFR